MMRKILRMVFIPVLLLLLVVHFCLPAIYGNKVERVKEGVRIYLGTDRKVYHPGDNVQVMAWIENISQEAIPYTMWNIGDPPFYVYISSEELKWQAALEEPDRPEIRLPVLNSELLKPGERIVRMLTWEQKIELEGENKSAPFGQYRIRATIYLGKYSVEQSEPITVELTIKIKE